MEERPPPTPISASSASTPSSPYSPLHPLLLPSPNPHLLLKPKILTLTLSSSSLASMASSPPPPPPPPPASDAWELVPAAAAPGDGGLDDCAIFPPRLHEGLRVEADDAGKEAEEDAEEEEKEWWGWGWGSWRAATRSAWAAGVGAVQERVMVHGGCGCAAVRPALWSAAAAAIVFGALLYARRRDKKERDLLVLLSQEKDKRIAQLLHQIAFINDMRSGGEALKAINNP